MEDKEKDLKNDILEENNKDITPQEDSPAEAENSDKVKYETNDNWKFDANAPTLSDDYFMNNDKFVVDKNDIKPNTTGKKTEKKYEKTSPIESNSDKIVISKEPLKFIPVALITLIVVVVLVILGVRYYTVPNGKEGDLMNPASVAATVDGDKVSLGMFNYYFSSVVNYYEQYAAYGYFDLDTTKDYSTQYTENDDGEKITWLERFTQEAIEEIKNITILYKAGINAGVKLTETQKETIESQMDSLKSNASSSNISLDDYLSQNFGEYCTEETIRLMLEQYYITFDYKGMLATQRDYTDDDINKYYEEHKNDYFKVNYCFIALEYDNSTEETISASNEEIKKYEAQITDRDSILKLVPTVYKDYIDQDVASNMEGDSSLTEEEARKSALENYEASIDAYMLGSEEPFGEAINEWLFSDATEIGSINHYIDEESGYAYIFLKTEEPSLLDDETYTVRHILVVPSNQEDESVAQTEEESASELTDEDWERAEKKAQEILDEFNEGDKSEYSFALLAEENSDDTASTSNSSTEYYGGLYETTKLGAMVSEFEDWATDDSRKYGDTGIIKSEYGYHIMFYIDSRPEYQSKIITDMREEKIEQTIENSDFKMHNYVINKAIKDFFADNTAENTQSQTASDDTTSASE